MGEITQDISIDAPPFAVFGYVDDWHNAPKFVHGLTTWEPVDGRSHGVGATFDIVVKLGPLKERSVVEVTHWEQDRLIGWEPREGFRQWGVWRFEPHGAGTLASFSVRYELPGGIAGKVLAKTGEPLAREGGKATLKALKEQVESRA